MKVMVYGVCAIAVVCLLVMAVSYGALDILNISDADMRRVMQQEGIADASFGGYQMFGCGQDDTFNQAFSGVKNGVHVQGVVCGGWLKGMTVRYR